jgi:GAF domain-containing protein
MTTQVMEPSLNRDRASSATANLSSANPASKVRFPAEDGGHSLVEMARRDLDAALQLLADRAQYITGASGAAIALRRNGKNDMLCRASTGSNAPELGALLSTEFGLSGESVRTRQPLRCDDAERDVRVNREVCRQLGIASVVVMPVVNDDGVLGVFELFSGRVNAFGERDLSAVQRLSEMVETAVRLAEATENLPERLKASELSAPAVGNIDAEEDRVLEGPELVPGDLVADEPVLDDLVLEDVVLKEPEPVQEVAGKESAQKGSSGTAGPEALAENREGAAPEPLTAETPTLPQAAREDGAPVTAGTAAAAPVEPKTVVPENVAAVPVEPKTVIPENVAAAPVEPKTVIPENVAAVPVEPKTVVSENVAAPLQAASTAAEPVPAPSVESALPKKQLLWSAELNPAPDAGKPEEADRSHVPPVLRGLRKCEACGFPVSAGRVLCVECEEKKWRGQLKVPQGAGARQIAIPAATAPIAVPPKEVRAFAAAQSAAASVSTPLTRGVPASAAPSSVGAGAYAAVKELSGDTVQPLPAARGANPATGQTLEPAAETLGTSSRDFVFSAGVESSQSWLSANKYIIGIVLLVAAVAVTAVFLLR